ncbi:MAG: hypothetical protein HC878_00130 [Leptolyngbyaceae cyanobacterium SL_5_14]|nr:hypothetical protein [Leptolyngbyaceae cyanobacterium SL_5_14]
MNYSVSQVALRFERSEQYIRRTAKEAKIGSQIKGVWQFSEDDLVSFETVFNPDTRPLLSQLEELDRDTAIVWQSRNSSALFAGALREIEPSSELDFDSVLENLERYNETLREERLQVRMRFEDETKSHADRMKKFSQLQAEAEEELIQINLDKKSLEQIQRESRAAEEAAMKKLITLRRLGVTLKKS